MSLRLRNGVDGMSTRIETSSFRARKVVLAAAGLVLALGASGCSTLEPEYGLSAPVVSRYVYRGAVINRDPVLQPEAWVSTESNERTWLVGGWSNVDLTDENGEQYELTEYNIYGEVAQTLGPVRAAMGFAHYRYERPDAPSTTEIQLVLSAESEVLTPGLELYYDIDEAQGFYGNFNVSREFEPVESWKLGLLAGVGWMSGGQAEYNFGVDADAWSDLLLQANLEHPLSEHLTLGITGAYSSVLDGELRDAVDDPDNLWLAIGLGVSF
jgi:hypothetical protein